MTCVLVLKTLSWNQCHHIFATSWTRQSRPLAFCPVITTFSAVTTDVSWLVPSSTNALTNSMWRSSEICQVLSTEAFTLFCQTCFQGTIAFCLHTLRKTAQTVFPLCTLACPRGRLFDASRLLGLTLRHSAPVCRCHRDSLTRWRLAFAQEAARVPSASSSHLLFLITMCLVISDSLRGMSFQGMWTYEGPASLVILFFTHCAACLLSHSQFSII